MENKTSMVLYKSAFEAIKYLPDEKQRWEAIEGLCNYGFDGIEPKSNNPFINMIYVQAIPSMQNAKQRYDKAVDNGKKGGKPTEVSTEEIMQMKSDGMTNKQIAEKIGCTVKNIENRVTTYNKSHPNNPNNLSVSVSVSDSVSESVSVSDSSSFSADDVLEQEKREEEREEKRETSFEDVLRSMNCNQLSEMKEMYDNRTPYKEIAEHFNLRYFNASEFTELYNSVHDEQYNREHPEEAARRAQLEEERKKAERERFLEEQRENEWVRHIMSQPYSKSKKKKVYTDLYAEILGE